MNPEDQVAEDVSATARVASGTPARADATPSPIGSVLGSGKLLPWVAVLALVALLTSGLLWQKLANIQEQLARQSADSSAQALDARALARQAQELSRETAARQTVMEARLSEVALQRSQLEELMQSLSRSRDENLVVDIESAVRLAQQQAQLTGSVEPLLAALKASEQRLVRAAQPRLTPLQRAIARDVDRIKSGVVGDTPALLMKLDGLVRLVDELPLANAAPHPGAAPVSRLGLNDSVQPWWQRTWQAVRQEALELLRVSRIEHPEAALLSPEQSFFLRENLKLKLLNARLGVLAHQTESVQTDLSAASLALTKYFDRSSRKTQLASSQLQQALAQMSTLRLPRLDDTLAALTTAAAGR